MILITRNIRIDEKELRFRFVRATGPGGQNVDKVATAVQLWFDVARSPSLPDHQCIVIFAVTGLSIRFWMQDAVTAGAIAAAIGLVLRLYGMSQWIICRQVIIPAGIYTPVCKIFHRTVKRQTL